MQQGPYIAERLLPHAVHAACERQSILYRAFSDDWVLRLQKGEQIRWVVGYKFDVNTSAAAELAQDKVATYMALAAAGIPAVEHYLIRSVPHDPKEFQYDKDELLGDRPVVIKPLDGTGGRAVERHETIGEALAMIRQSEEPAWAASPYYELRSEYRLVMLGDTILLSLEKTQPTLRGKLKLFNLGYGATAVDITDQALLERLQNTAVGVMRAMSLSVASVDIARLHDGSMRVLEVNDGITLEHYARQSDDYKNRAANVYDAVVQSMFEQSSLRINEVSAELQAGGDMITNSFRNHIGGQGPPRK